MGTSNISTPSRSCRLSAARPPARFSHQHLPRAGYPDHLYLSWGYHHHSNYANACGWDNKPGPGPSHLHRTSQLSGGLLGGTTQTTYTVQVIAPGTVTLSGAIYAYTGTPDSFVYEAITPNLVITAVNQVTLTPTISQKSPRRAP